MPSSWALVLVVLGGACALPAPAPLTYTQALAQAVNSFNQRPEVQNALRVLSADPEPTPVSATALGTLLGHPVSLWGPRGGGCQNLRMVGGHGLGCRVGCRGTLPPPRLALGSR